MSSSSDIEELLTPPELKETAQAVIENLLPEKSRYKYNKAYEDFLLWKSGKNAPSFSQNVLLSYFSEKAQKFKPSTLWTLYSMLKSTIMARNDINIMEYTKLTAFLKRKSEGFRSKKSKVLTKKDVYSFLLDAPDDKYLLMKVILILGINGACRSQELVDITTDDIEVHDNEIIIKLPDTKTKNQRSFVISDLSCDIVKKYLKLRPNEMTTKRFLLQFRDSKCTKQVAGKNKISSVAKEIASYLNLPNPHDYTGHCFRRTSATLLADTGADLTTIKRPGGWKPATVAEKYVENSVENKIRINNQIAESITLHQDSSPQPSTSAASSSSPVASRVASVQPQPSMSAVPIAPRQKRLNLVDREDLMEKADFKIKSYQVCAADFEDSAIATIKHLKATPIPTRFLPTKSLVSSSTASKGAIDVESEIADFPKNPTRRSDWTTIIRRNRGEKFYEPPGFSHVCSVHFHPSDIYTTAGGFKRLSKSARPTLQMVTQTGSASTSQQSDRDLLDPNDQSDSSLISDPEETSGAPAPSGPDVGQKTLSVVFLCKACLKNITSFRYRCLVCPDYEMCGDCERRGGHHDDHYVLRVPMQRPTVEIDQVETAVRRALSSFPIWNKAFKSTAKPKVVKKKLIKTTVNKPDKTRNSEDSIDDTGSDSEDTEDEPSALERKPVKAIPKLVTIKTEAVDSDDEPVVKVRKSGTIKTEAVDSVDEPVVKVELVIKEEEDPLEEEDAASAILQNIHERQTTSGSKDDPPTQVVPSYHIAQSSQGVPWSYIVPLTHGAPKPQSVPSAQDVPPSKRRRADEHRSTTTTHSHKTTPTMNEPTGLCTETSSSLTAVTSSETGSKVDVLATALLEPRSRTACRSRRRLLLDDKRPSLVPRRLPANDQPSQQFAVFVLKKRTRPADENYD